MKSNFNKSNKAEARACKHLPTVSTTKQQHIFTGERIVSSLVHQPAAATLRDAQNHQRNQDLSVAQQPEATNVHHQDLQDAIGHVQWSGLEESLLLQLVSSSKS